MTPKAKVHDDKHTHAHFPSFSGVEMGVETVYYSCKVLTVLYIYIYSSLWGGGGLIFNRRFRALPTTSPGGTSERMRFSEFPRRGLLHVPGTRETIDREKRPVERWKGEVARGFRRKTVACPRSDAATNPITEVAMGVTRPATGVICNSN